MSLGSKIISTILKHDTKATSYKIALLRAINDVVLSFPDLRNLRADVAVPLRLLAQFWVAYYCQTQRTHFARATNTTEGSIAK
jgi:hypothetical protein